MGGWRGRRRPGMSMDFWSIAIDAIDPDGHEWTYTVPMSMKAGTREEVMAWRTTVDLKKPYNLDNIKSNLVAIYRDGCEPTAIDETPPDEFCSKHGIDLAKIQAWVKQQDWGKCSGDPNTCPLAYSFRIDPAVPLCLRTYEDCSLSRRETPCVGTSAA